MARVKQIIGWTVIVLFAATLAGIWVLTEQNAVETSLLSESTARVVEGQATGVQAVDATGEAQAENGMTGGTDSAASNVRSGRLASIRMWVGTNVRRVAHTVEFFFVGLFASVVVVCFGSVRPGLTFRPVIFLRLHNGRPLSNLNPARGDAPETGRVARLALPFHADLPANSPSPRRAPAS